MVIIGSIIILLIISSIYSKMADISFGTALGKILKGIAKAILAIFSFLLDRMASNSNMHSIREKARKAGRADIVAGIDDKKAQAKGYKERVDNIRRNL